MPSRRPNLNLVEPQYLADRPALISSGRLAKPNPKPEPPDEDDEDAAARRPPTPAGNGHFPPRPASVAEPQPRETTVYSACKMPLSMDQAVKRIARERGVSASEIVRYFVAEGLRTPFAQPRAAGQ